MLPIIAASGIVATIAEVAQVVMVIILAIVSIMAAINSLKKNGVDFDSVSELKANATGLGII